MSFLPNNKDLCLYARKLRTCLTEAEMKLWLYLRKKQLLGIQFYRQKVIGNYIVDFYAPSIYLVIEIDGSQHFEHTAMEADRSRDLYMSELGIKVLRFDNFQVKNSINSVLDEIYEYIENNLRENLS
ncbi:MAG: endonuclease domain-containing protein [Gammaproteobacteria bacterium]|jgi:very-short-patch-repair endonuclease|nr:endonuclease domain-containing protein [Gammaproteobacteria bacterium]